MNLRLLVTPLLAIALSTLTVASVQLTGANGRSVEFVGIWEARPEGLVVVTTAESDPIVVTWDKFDLAKLKVEQPALEAARQRAVFLRSTQPVNLGLFAEILTASQVGTEIRRMLDVPSTVKVPLAFRTTTETVVQAQLVTLYPTVWDGLVLAQPVNTINQSSKTSTETRQLTPDEITTTPRRVLTQLSRSEGVLASDRRALFELNKVNPRLLEEAAQGLERIRASLPPKRLLANDPTLQTLDHRLTEAIANIRDLAVGQTISRAQQDRIREFLALADHPILR
ncbi:MAG: hypothetical protein H2172_10820 [Opitutus sp.]|nr:hypothetical protein [Opitutus sp.]MCS6248566.1 hypothetical protein [Opitutus sp.]MCS6275331.1 hypothetical protein [Opitutus sp.]MCS6276843.1 hypothetical protein [Opitutus sp.]MCS6301508.1 hypothetical protein [Opitutus sp.]